MLALPELHIQTVLKNGFEKLSANIDLLDDLLYNYPKDMQSEAKKYLKTHKVPVVLNLPREGLTEPTVAILCASDVEDPGKDVLGDVQMELEVAAADTDITEYRGITKQGTYQLYCLCSDPRLAMYIAYFVESLIILNAEELQKQGLHNIVLSSGDLRFEENLLPEWSNSRVVTLTCLHYHAVPVTEKLLTQLCVYVNVEI